MKKMMIMAALSVAVCSVMAEAKLVPMEKFLKHTGGFVVRPGSQKGEICYVNAQQRVPKAWIDESIAYFVKCTRFKISYKEGAFDMKAPKIEGNATLYIIDDETMPTLLIAPENRWAFVNVAPIAKEQRPAFFEARVKKELTRGFCFLCGATNSQYPRSLTRGIVNHEDLDKNPDLELPVDVISRFKTYMETLGVTPAIQLTYRKACQEGWAAAPTNDYQKAIWDQVHEPPANPMKIEFDPKKGR